MDFSNVAGVYDRWHDRVLVAEWNKDANLCTIISDDGLHTYTLSRSAIMADDDAIRRCCSDIAEQRTQAYAAVFTTAIDSARYRDLFRSRRTFDADLNEQVQLPAASSSDGGARTPAADWQYFESNITYSTPYYPPIPTDEMGSDHR